MFLMTSLSIVFKKNKVRELTSSVFCIFFMVVRRKNYTFSVELEAPVEYLIRKTTLLH